MGRTVIQPSMSTTSPTAPIDRREAEGKLRAVQAQFRCFLELLEQNNQVLKVIGDMEEKSEGEYLFDLAYIRLSLEKVRGGAREIIERMIALGGDRYAPMRQRFAEIDERIRGLLPGQRTISEGAFVLWFEQIGREHASEVGSKNAQLGEIRNRLGLPVPDGFAITAFAYKRFLEENGLEQRIRESLGRVDLRHHEDLVRVSREIRQMVLASPVPAEVAAAIRDNHKLLVRRCGVPVVAMRSSAMGEDSFFSFAGQYATYLNVMRPRLVEIYREVIASKYTPQAIYYALSHSLGEADLAMSVGCVAMVDAASSGVVYTRDPVRPEEDSLLIHSVYGLGEALVDGTLAPDVFRISRSDRRVEAALACKRTLLAMREEGGTAVVDVPLDLQERSSLSDGVLEALTDFGLRLEAHYGGAQDIEFAVDRAGRPIVLQTRRLQLLARSEPSSLPRPDAPLLLKGGATACPGGGAGKVVHVASRRDLASVPDGAVLVAPTPFPGLITAMGRARAIVTEVGGVASHMATLAREYRVPALVGVAHAADLPAGEIVTVDATAGEIWAGAHPELVASRQPSGEHIFEDTPLFQGFKQILSLVAPLRLLHPSDEGFTVENCRTIHDLTRYAHQRAMEEMFAAASDLKHTEHLGLRLRSEIPLPVYLVYIDRSADPATGGWVEEGALDSEPLAAIWAGMREQGWPSLPTDLRSQFTTVLATAAPRRPPESYSVTSYAVLSQSYVMLCLHLGFHFTTIEAMATDQMSKNYIRLQYKDGGATIERRVRRIRLIASLLSDLGFDNASQRDFLDAAVVYAERASILEKLRVLGRIVLLTKQLDMALSSDAITEWYTEDFRKKLAIKKGRRA
jgi:pyruvate,water dikinase